MPFWTARYFLALAPVLYLALALGIDHLLRRVRSVGVAVATFVLAVLAVRVAFYCVEPQREDWRAVVAYASQVAMPATSSGSAARRGRHLGVLRPLRMPAHELWTGAPAGSGAQPAAATAGPARDTAAVSCSYCGPRRARHASRCSPS